MLSGFELYPRWVPLTTPTATATRTSETNWLRGSLRYHDGDGCKNVRLSQLGHNVLSLVSIWSPRSLRTLKKKVQRSQRSYGNHSSQLSQQQQKYQHALRTFTLFKMTASIRFSSLFASGESHAEEHLRQKFHTELMTQISVYITNPVVMGFQI